MSVRLYTEDAAGLLDAIKGSIDEGHIETWDYDEDGDFTHTPDQWFETAWLRPSLEDDSLLLNILPPKGVNISSEVYAVYHGRFIEMAIEHFEDWIGDAVATAAVDDGDVVA
ncbi:MAG TPA: hypothetical protein VN934_03695 [Candidatus Tumulicola sp.]|nr:hypothetical protein [Candidatus Tumulicola sp.]